MSAPSATNVYRAVTPADLLNQQRMILLASQSPNSGANNFTPDYILPIDDGIDITDAITVNGGLASPADEIDITDSFSMTSQTGGTFLIDTAQIGFSDVA